MNELRGSTSGVESAGVELAIQSVAREQLRAALGRLLVVALALVVAAQGACLLWLAGRAPSIVWIESSSLIRPAHR